MQRFRQRFSLSPEARLKRAEEQQALAIKAKAEQERNMQYMRQQRDTHKTAYDMHVNDNAGISAKLLQQSTFYTNHRTAEKNFQKIEKNDAAHARIQEKADQKVLRHLWDQAAALRKKEINSQHIIDLAKEQIAKTTPVFNEAKKGVEDVSAKMQALKQRIEATNHRNKAAK